MVFSFYPSPRVKAISSHPQTFYNKEKKRGVGMHLKRIKNAMIGLMSLQFLLSGFQIWSLLKGEPSPAVPLFMMGVSFVVIRWGNQAATGPELTAVKELKWD